MIDPEGLAGKLPDLQLELRHTLRHQGAVDSLLQLMPLFLAFLQHEGPLHRELSPDARQKLETVQAAARTLAERIKEAEGEPVERIRGYLANALTPRTTPASSSTGDVLVRTAVAIAVHLDVSEDARRVEDGLPARELVNNTVQQANAMVGIIDQILRPTGRSDANACKIIAFGVAEILVDNGIRVSATPDGAFDTSLRAVLEALDAYAGDEQTGLLEIGVEHVTLEKGNAQ
jgi:hypothetical protein